ncbi:methyl-accepting chemotaxis protein [Pseudoduganella sp. GCM10020061]|uniref:methyl-accepting chemotaxis protein n=1 Tax=Pseudoduganella sp. GCM10020061 TaxID=3317345 RepID=UPI0036404E4E
MFKSLSIKARLILVLSFLCVQLLVGAFIGIGSLSLSNASMQSMYADRLVPIGQLDRIMGLLDKNQMALARSLTTDPAEAAQLMNGVEANIPQISKIWDTYMQTRLTDEERILAERFAAARKAYLADGLAPAIAAVRGQDIAGATVLVNGKMASLIAPVRSGLDELIRLQERVAKAEYEENESTYLLIRNTCIAALILGMAVAISIGVWLVRAITRPLNEAVEIAGHIAAGDLTQQIEVKSQDEMGVLTDALKKMNDSLVSIVGQVRTGTDMIATASNQIASGNMDLSARTEQQASSLEETASSIEELTSTVRQNADNARQANSLAQSASDVAGKGGAVVSEVVTTMDAINESAKKIVDIIGVIDGIAFQTNILALNAAVEAARAGEQGRGFAVVASEVRSLAQRSANAAKEIKELIGDSVEKVEAGSRLVNQAGTTMAEVVDSVKRVTDIMAEITAASVEQTAGIEQINQAITQMDDVTQQNASLVEEAAAAAQSLEQQAGELSQLVSIFKVERRRTSRAASAGATAAAPQTTEVATLPVRRPPAKRLARQAAARPAASERAPAPAATEEWEEF